MPSLSGFNPATFHKLLGQLYPDYTGNIDATKTALLIELDNLRKDQEKFCSSLPSGRSTQNLKNALASIRDEVAQIFDLAGLQRIARAGENPAPAYSLAELSQKITALSQRVIEFETKATKPKRARTAKASASSPTAETPVDDEDQPDIPDPLPEDLFGSHGNTGKQSTHETAPPPEPEPTEDPTIDDEETHDTGNIHDETEDHHTTTEEPDLDEETEDFTPDDRPRAPFWKVAYLSGLGLLVICYTIFSLIYRRFLTADDWLIAFHYSWIWIPLFLSISVVMWRANEYSDELSNDAEMGKPKGLIACLSFFSFAWLSAYGILRAFHGKPFEQPSAPSPETMIYVFIGAGAITWMLDTFEVFRFRGLLLRFALVIDCFLALLIFSLRTSPLSYLWTGKINDNFSLSLFAVGILVTSPVLFSKRVTEWLLREDRRFKLVFYSALAVVLLGSVVFALSPNKEKLFE